MPKVYNKSNHDAPEGAVYVGRPTVFCNPYTITHYRGRDEVCDLFAAYVARTPKLVEKIKLGLAGKDLVCWCAPERCHADLLLKIANEKE